MAMSFLQVVGLQEPPRKTKWKKDSEERERERGENGNAIATFN